MLSRRLTEARPVRNVANFRRASSTLDFIFPSASALTCLMSIASHLVDYCYALVLFGSLVAAAHARTDALAEDNLEDVAALPEIEDDDRQQVVAAERDRRGVHHFELVREHLVVGDLLEELGSLVHDG